MNFQHIKQIGKKTGQNVQSLTAEIVLLAERRLGEMLDKNIPHKGGRPNKQLDNQTVLSELGISKFQSHCWQTEAMVGARAKSFYAKEAKRRQRDHGETAPGKPKDTSGKFTGSDLGDTRDKAAEKGRVFLFPDTCFDTR